MQADGRVMRQRHRKAPEHVQGYDLTSRNMLFACKCHVHGFRSPLARRAVSRLCRKGQAARAAHGQLPWWLYYAFIPTIQRGIITLALINMEQVQFDQFAAVGTRITPPVLAYRLTLPAIICGLLFAGIISQPCPVPTLPTF